MISFKQAIKKSLRFFISSMPTLLGTILLISLATKLIPSSFYLRIFHKNLFFDPLVGATLGSVSAGSPIISYILGGEFLSAGISLVAVTAFLVAWVTVGIIQYPAESSFLGHKFALVRNISSFILSLLVAIITVLVVMLL